MKRATLWLMVAVLAVAAAIAALFMRGNEGADRKAAAAPEASSPAVAAPPVVSAPVAVAPAAPTVPAPWERPAGTDAGPATARAAGAASASTDKEAAARDERMRALEKVSARLQALRASNRADPAEVDKALGDLERIQGSSVVGGVDLSVVRASLRAATRMQELQKEIEQLRPATGEPTEANKAKLAEKYKEMQAVIAQMQASTGAVQATRQPFTKETP